MFIATLIAKDMLGRSDIITAAEALDRAGLIAGSAEWIDEGSAFDLSFSGDPATARSVLEPIGIDVVVQPREGRRRRLLVADMDSTMISVECIDELAHYAGVGSEVAEVTEQAMLGKLDFEAALRARVALLSGLDEGVIDRCLAERVKIMPGARTLVGTMRAHGAYCLLVSGGFTRFARPVAQRIGFDRSVSNRLEIRDGKLTGRLLPPIVDAKAKLEAMKAEAASLEIPLSAVIAVGDGANDRPMIEAAGLGIAFRAKPALARAADARIERSDLTALLHAQGYSRREWVD